MKSQCNSRVVAGALSLALALTAVLPSVSSAAQTGGTAGRGGGLGSGGASTGGPSGSRGSGNGGEKTADQSVFTPDGAFVGDCGEDCRRRRVPIVIVERLPCGGVLRRYDVEFDDAFLRRACFKRYY